MFLKLNLFSLLPIGPSAHKNQCYYINYHENKIDFEWVRSLIVSNTSLVRDEFTLSASASDDAPESPIPLPLE